MVIALKNVFDFFSQAMGFGMGIGIAIDLFMYGIIKAIHLVNIKL